MNDSTRPSFANVKEADFTNVKRRICQTVRELYNKYDFLLDGEILNEDEKRFYRSVSAEMEDYVAMEALRALLGYLMRHYGKKVLIG